MVCITTIDFPDSPPLPIMAYTAVEERCGPGRRRGPMEKETGDGYEGLCHRDPGRASAHVGSTIETAIGPMPRTRLEPRFHVEYLSILDSDGNVDTALEPELSTEELKRLYRAMLLGRRLDERMVRLQRQGRIGTFAPIKGQEASQLGSVAVLRPTDWMVPSFRETAAMIWRGWPIEKLLLFFAGHLER